MFSFTAKTDLLYTTSEDNDWIHRIATGDEDAFTKLFNTYYNKLGVFVFRFTKSIPLTQEIVQDIFLKLWEKREELLHVKNFDAWLFVIARNHTYNVLSQNLRNRKLMERWEKEATIATIDPSEINKANDQYLESLEQAVLLLPPQQQKVYILSKKQGWKLQAIAEELNISLFTTKKHLARAVTSIKRYLSESYKKLNIF